MRRPFYAIIAHSELTGRKLLPRRRTLKSAPDDPGTRVAALLHRRDLLHRLRSVLRARAEGRHFLVLGAGVKGRQPTPSLEGRLFRAREYLKRHTDTIAIMCGARGFMEDISEAALMRK